MSDLTQLLTRCKEGNDEAISIVVNRFHPRALDLAESIIGDKHLAEDVVQESFFIAFTQLQQLRCSAAFAGWLLQIVRNCSKRIFVKQKEQTLENFPQVISEMTPLDMMASKEMKQIIQQAIQKLSRVGRETLELFYLEQHNQKKVAEILGIPQGTVKRRLHDARQRLREMLLGKVLVESKHQKKWKIKL